MNVIFNRPLLYRSGLFCVLFLCATGPSLDAQFKFREPPNRQQPEALSTEAGELVWEWFLWNREIGRFAIEGSLIYRPSGSASREFQMRLEGNWSGPCHATSITLSGPGLSPVRKDVEVCDEKVTVMDTGEEGEPMRVTLGNADLSGPVFEGLPFTWNDLLMPYLRWAPPEYVGPVRFLGRPAHKFALRNPNGDAFPARVIVTVDEDYAALLEAEMVDRDGFVAKRMRVDGFRKFGEEWMFSGLTWENRRERASVRLKVYSFKSTNL